jgi:hypothetical protein
MFGFVRVRSVCSDAAPGYFENQAVSREGLRTNLNQSVFELQIVRNWRLCSMEKVPWSARFLLPL